MIDQACPAPVELKPNLSPPLRAAVVAWHRVYATAARELARDLTMRGVSVALPEGREGEQERAEAGAFVALASHGFVEVAVRRLDPLLVARGTARLFLPRALSLHVQEWLEEVAAWEDRWLRELEREELVS